MLKVRGCVSSRGLFYRPNGVSNGMEYLGAFDVRGSSLENCAKKRGAARVRGTNHSVREELRVGKVRRPVPFAQANMTTTVLEAPPGGYSR